MLATARISTVVIAAISVGIIAWACGLFAKAQTVPFAAAMASQSDSEAAAWDFVEPPGRAERKRSIRGDGRDAPARAAPAWQ